MGTINFTDKEQETLVEMLEREIPNLRHEIHHTDDREYREFLKEKEKLLHALLSKLKEDI
jgi:hypothetical protein